MRSAGHIGTVVNPGKILGVLVEQPPHVAITEITVGADFLKGGLGAGNFFYPTLGNHLLAIPLALAKHQVGYTAHISCCYVNVISRING